MISTHKIAVDDEKKIEMNWDCFYWGAYDIETQYNTTLHILDCQTFFIIFNRNDQLLNQFW